MIDPLALLTVAACARIAVRVADAACQVWTLRARARLTRSAAHPSPDAHDVQGKDEPVGCGWREGLR